MRDAIKAATKKKLDESELEDDYARRLRKLVESKRKKGAGVKTAPAAANGDGEDGGAEVIDLMEVLKRSLRGGEEDARKTRRAGGGSSGRSAGGRASSDGDLSGLTKAELYERAQELDISGRSSMTKDELVAAIRKSA